MNFTFLKMYRYFYAALIGAFFDFIFFIIFYRYTSSIYLSNFLAFILGTYINFIVCKFYVFKNQSITKSKFFLNFILTFLTVFISSFFISIFSPHFNVIALKLFAYIITFLINFSIRNFFIFV